MKKLKLIISDFHIGKGNFSEDGSVNIMEDFNHDQKFIEFLTFYSTDEHKRTEIELIINGDFFNLIQVDYKENYPIALTEQVETNKVRMIISGHPEIFDALRNFNASPNKSITFMLGNHDLSLVWDGVKDAVRERIGGKIIFRGLSYFFDGIYVEHGHQYEAANRLDPNNYFLTRGLAEPILNLPWGSFFMVKFINLMKNQRPYIDRVKPFQAYLRWALFNDLWFAIKAICRLLFYFFWLRFTKSKWRHSKFTTTLKIIKESYKPIDLEKYADEILGSGDCRVVIFGHTHVSKYRRFANGKEYFNTGTWTDVILLDISNLGRRSELTFAIIEYKGNIPHTSLKIWRGKYNVVADVFY